MGKSSMDERRQTEEDLATSQAMQSLLKTLLSAAFLAGPVASEPGAAAPVEFSRDIHPLLKRACFDCHGPHKQKGELRLDSHGVAFKGGSSGPVIVPGNAAESELYRRVTLPKGHDDIMPNRGEPLSFAETDRIKAWIDAGADWPEELKAATHWAYVKPLRPALPPVKNTTWPRNEIDRFILARLESEGLSPSPEAERARLVRRVYLDLIGLPPSPEAVDAFVADSGVLAFEKIVDRLLASPQFGERWARPWLDLARYADSHGFQRDDLRESWPYRDWVIHALNADMPFDRFSIEQLAGDLLPKANTDQKIATGFHRAAPSNVEAGTDQEENRVNQVFDRVNTTAAVWLGTTLECAQCHDHKYDPFTQKEYYQLFAFFNNTPKETDYLNPKAMASLKFIGPYLAVPEPGTESQRQRVENRIKGLDDRIQTRIQQLHAGGAQWEQQMAVEATKAGRIHPLEIASFESSGGANHKILGDHSVLLSDNDAPPERDIYTIKVQTKLAEITGFKLEALADASLPGDGPGRGDRKNPNFVLNSFKVSVAPADGSGGQGAPEPIRLKNARASFSQKNFDVAGAIDDNLKSAWAISPEFHRDHWAAFETERPVGFAEGSTFIFTLEQNYGAARTMGRLRLSALTGDPSADALPADIAEILRASADQHSTNQNQRLEEFYLSQDKTLRSMRIARTKAEKEFQDLKPPQTLVMQELAEPRISAALVRGNFLERGETVSPGTPAALHAFYADPVSDLHESSDASDSNARARPESAPTNRLALARWLVNKENPLVARVTVNRWWAELFGRGIVSTTEDFGVKGELPTHPELLDWLAGEFMDNGWSMKKLLKTIVMSATYRQSSRTTPALLARDDQNQLYARGPRFRMDAEMIRDNALAAAGLLSLKQGGPPVRPYQPPGLWESKVGGDRVTYELSEGEDAHRRGIYVVWKRASPYPSFVNFDAPARTACVLKRSRSNTPSQALTLLNDPVSVEAALALARRVWNDCPNASVEDRIRHAFRLCLARSPKEEEVSALRTLLKQELAVRGADPDSAKALLGRFQAPKGANPTEFAAWYAVASALLNLDEMITKG